MLNIHNLHINHVNLLNIIIFLKIVSITKGGYSHSFTIKFIFLYASLSQNINVNNFSIIYPKIKFESIYINITPTMILNHIEEFEKYKERENRK